MSEISTIEWTDATWNPVTGCTKVSPGCKFCYAETFAERFRGVPGHPYEQGFDLRLWPDRLELPLKWKPRRIFVNSMSDLFHEEVPDEYIEKVFDVMIRAHQHIFQVLTKRSGRMMEWTRKRFRFVNELNDRRRSIMPAHIWLGVSVESQEYAFRIKNLQKVPSRVRFLSVEPLLGPVKFSSALLRGIHWVIVGGESGPAARPMKPEWALGIQTECGKYEVPFFFKQ